jgi:two-component system chemotaxis response regulator CheY
VRALVVDDSKPSRSIVARALADLRFDCIEAGNGQEALAALAASGRPDLITVNWHMPVMDGIELVTRLRREPAYRGLPILMISTEHDQDRIAVARQAGITEYLAKPFTAAALARKLIDLGVVAEPAAASGREPIAVLICDDSATIRGILSATLGTDPDVKVVGTAINGAASPANCNAEPPVGIQLGSVPVSLACASACLTPRERATSRRLSSVAPPSNCWMPCRSVSTPAPAWIAARVYHG